MIERNKIRSLTLITLIVFFLFSCVTGEKKEFDPDPKIIVKTNVKTLPIGASAPDFYLPGVDGRFYRLSDFDRSKLLLVIFMSNHCPESQMYENVIKDIDERYKRKDLQVVCISPNSPLAVLYEDLQYSDLGDDYESIKIRAEVKEFKFPYLYDGDDHSVTLKYGAVSTPQVFLFDSDRKLRYKGGFDLDPVRYKVSGELVIDAVEALLQNKDVAVPVAESIGCGIKWSWYHWMKEEEDRRWKKRPVTLKDIDLDDVKILLSNPAKKLLLLNFWASWCAPCVEELPAFVEVYRMYYSNLEVVTISVDKYQKKDKVLELLKKHHASFSNYIYKDKELTGLIKNVKPFWNGSVPLTILIEPDGEVANMWYGKVYPYVLKRAIVENDYMGRIRNNYLH
jgi:peroxiredoxin